MQIFLSTQAFSHSTSRYKVKMTPIFFDQKSWKIFIYLEPEKNRFHFDWNIFYIFMNWELKMFKLEKKIETCNFLVLKTEGSFLNQITLIRNQHGNVWNSEELYFPLIFIYNLKH